MVRTAPVLAWLFLLPALSLIGIPPFSGFVSKLALVDAGMAVDEYAIVGVSLLVSFLTVLSMIRIWAGVFWNPAEGPDEGGAPPPTPPRLGGPLFMVVPTAALVLVSLGVAAWAGPLFDVSERSARDMLDRDRYVDEVLGQ
jgi:multicomponent Na+:H+ antiporter subunit D